MLAVVYGHSQLGPNGLIALVGVEVFFVMSGFLITALLIEEYRWSDTIDLRSFYRRRVARLFPAMVITLLFCMMLAVILGWRSALIGVIANLGYMANVAKVTDIDIAPLNHTWSLSVEEHFYLVWPALFIFASRWKRGVLVAAIVLVVMSTGWRIWLQADGAGWYRVTEGTDTRIAGIALGCFGAWLWYSRPIRVPSIVVSACFAVLLYCGTMGGTDWVTALPAMQVATLLVVLHCASASMPGVLGMRPLVRAGKLSYAAYLFHLPILAVVRDDQGVLTLPRTIGALAAVWLAAELSMRFVELPANERWGWRSSDATRRRSVESREAPEPEPI